MNFFLDRAAISNLARILIAPIRNIFYLMFKLVQLHQTPRVHVPHASRDATKRGNYSLIIKSAKILGLAKILPRESSIHNKPLVWYALSWPGTLKTFPTNHQKGTPTWRLQ